MKTRASARFLQEACDPSFTDSMHALPSELLEEVLSYLPATDILAAALSCKYVFCSAFVDRVWKQAFCASFPTLTEIIEACPPRWWNKSGWYQRYRLLTKGASFTAQVFNRESDNPSEDFYLSAYEATLSVQKPFSPSNPTFVARYLPMANHKVVEKEIIPSRIRKRTPNTSPVSLYPTDLNALRIHEEVEVQWKAMPEHPYGWWLAAIQDVQPDMMVLVFLQYEDQSPWHAVVVPISVGTDSVVNWNTQYGFVGGVRSLTAEERQQWKAQRQIGIDAVPNSYRSTTQTQATEQPAPA